jgi:hypothetical protein
MVARPYELSRETGATCATACDFRIEHESTHGLPDVLDAHTSYIGAPGLRFPRLDDDPVLCFNYLLNRAPETQAKTNEKKIQIGTLLPVSLVEGMFQAAANSENPRQVGTFRSGDKAFSQRRLRQRPSNTPRLGKPNAPTEGWGCLFPERMCERLPIVLAEGGSDLTLYSA